MGIISLIVGGILDARKAIKENQAKLNNELQHIAVAGKYEIDLPTFLSPMKGNEDASLEYGNKTLDVWFAVVDEPKEDFESACVDFGNIFTDEDKTLLDKFTTVGLSSVLEEESMTIERYRKTEINGCPAIVVDMFRKRTFFKDAVSRCTAFVEGKDRLYQIIVVTGGTGILKLAAKLEASIYSFKEL